MSEAWDPRGFGDYARHYPASPRLEPLARADASARFVEAWERLGGGGAAGLASRAAGTAFVLVRGLFGTWIPGNFSAPLRALRGAGIEAMIARTGPVATLEENAAALGRDVEARAPADHRLLFLCHSKGGLDALQMLLRFARLRQRTRAVVLCQTPREGCPILESVLLGDHAESLAGGWERAREGVARGGLAVAGARAGCLEVTRDAIGDIVTRLDAARLGVRLVSVATWSIAPTAWLDSQHARMRAVRPGCAHDGLFFTESLVWPAGEQVLLPRLDHSQPTVGGAGLDHARLWLALASLALDAGP